MKRPILLFSLIVILTCLQSLTVQATDNDSKVDAKLEKYFDHNHDGVLSYVERNHYNNYFLFGWPIAKSKQSKKFDENKDDLLGPAEEQLFREDLKKHGKKVPRFLKKKRRPATCFH